MSTLMSPRNIKIALVMVVLFLMLLAEPVLARKARNKGGKSGRGGQKSRQVTETAADNEVRQSSNARKARDKVTPPSQAAKPKTKTRSRNRDNFRRTAKSDLRRSRAEKPEAFDTERHTRDSFDSRKRGRAGFDTRRHSRESSSDATNLIQQSPRRNRVELMVRDRQRREHIYARRHPGRTCRRYPRRIFHRVVWPEYRHIVYYNWGPYFTFRYVHPYHHRKYIFVGLGGFWPVEYRYIRYYWYGCHPYSWCGHYPSAYQVKGDTYNYYTYNYYDNDNAAPSQATSGIKPVDHTTFADVREKLARQSAGEPSDQTLADSYFEDAVKAFEKGDYDIAVDKFAEAVNLEPDDMVLPFAYVQALFADEQYSKAAEVLREAIGKLPPDQEGVFFPRGLYPDDDILFEQIDHLAEKADLHYFDGDLQLLLGYQLLGVEKLDQAIEPLQRARLEPANKDAAALLLNLLKKIEADKTGAENNTT